MPPSKPARRGRDARAGAAPYSLHRPTTSGSSGASASGPTDEDLRRLFTRLDRNNGGTISRAELVKAARTDPEARAIFKLPVTTQYMMRDETEHGQYIGKGGFCFCRGRAVKLCCGASIMIIAAQGPCKYCDAVTLH